MYIYIFMYIYIYIYTFGDGLSGLGDTFGGGLRILPKLILFQSGGLLRLSVPMTNLSVCMTISLASFNLYDESFCFMLNKILLCIAYVHIQGWSITEGCAWVWPTQHYVRWCVDMHQLCPYSGLARKRKVHSNVLHPTICQMRCCDPLIMTIANLARKRKVHSNVLHPTICQDWHRGFARLASGLCWYVFIM